MPEFRARLGHSTAGTSIRRVAGVRRNAPDGRCRSVCGYERALASPLKDTHESTVSGQQEAPAAGGGCGGGSFLRSYFLVLMYKLPSEPGGD